jgi:hypothetical protein
MRCEILEEPELEFSAGRHIDIRFGLTNLGPVDNAQQTAPREIRLGVVGSAKSVDALSRWIDRCRSGIEGKRGARLPNLFPRFPGFGAGQALQADAVTSAPLQRSIPEPEIKRLLKIKGRTDLIAEASTVFLNELEALCEKGAADVLVCAIPLSLLVGMWKKGEDTGGEDLEMRLDFHDLLKAQAMRLGKPLQLVLPMTVDDNVRLPQVARPSRPRQLQDAATRAWNFYVALYYKAGGTPWRLVRDPAQLTTCYVGVSFFQSLEKQKLDTSCAQVFNERGEGLILRGGQATVAKKDLQPHLSRDAAADLLAEALATYRNEHRTLPARIVLFKTSSLNNDEIGGFEDALAAAGVDTFDLLSIRPSTTRLFRRGAYPALRGTFLSKDDRTHVLYTRGSTPFFSTYPGMYVPRPIEFTCTSTSESPRVLASEILALSKMNWNNTQFDNADPIVVAAARRVGHILRYTSEGGAIQRRYSFYM